MRFLEHFFFAAQLQLSERAVMADASTFGPALALLRYTLFLFFLLFFFFFCTTKRGTTLLLFLKKNKRGNSSASSVSVCSFVIVKLKEHVSDESRLTSK